MGSEAAVPQFVQAVVAALSMIGGWMAAISGFWGFVCGAAFLSYEALVKGINIGAVLGFLFGIPWAVTTFLSIML